MKITDDQLKQIIKEEVMANEGLMDFLRDPTGRKARAKIADLERQVAQASSEAEKLKAEKEKAALEKAAEERGLLDKARADYAQASDAADKDRRQREKKYHADLKKFVPTERDFIDDFLARRAHYFDMAQEFKDTYMKGFTPDGIPPEMTLDGRTLREYVFVSAPQDAEVSISSRIEHDIAKNRGMTGGSGDKRFPSLMGKPAYYNYNNGNIVIVDPNSNVYVSYADYRDSPRYKGDLNQNALFRTIIQDLKDRGYVQSTKFTVPMSPENLRALRGEN